MFPHENETMLQIIRKTVTAEKPVDGEIVSAFSQAFFGKLIINKAKISCETTKQAISHHFVDVSNKVYILFEEVVDIEDMDTGINIMDLGLNEFRLDLLSYMKDNPDIEHTPFGMSAVVAPSQPSRGEETKVTGTSIRNAGWDSLKHKNL